MGKIILPGQERPTWQQYDDEFNINIDAKTAAELRKYEEGERYTATSQQSKEELKRLEELNKEARKIYRWQHQDDFKMDRQGKILHYKEFIRRLNRILPQGFSAWYSDKGGMAKTLGLYISHPGIAGALCTHKPGEVHYACFVQVPFMQEYEELYFDKYDVPLGSKRRGWRTVLLKLIEQNIITEAQAHEAFGNPVSGPISLRYREYLQYLRQRTIGFK